MITLCSLTNEVLLPEGLKRLHTFGMHDIELGKKFTVYDYIIKDCRMRILVPES